MHMALHIVVASVCAAYSGWPSFAKRAGGWQGTAYVLCHSVISNGSSTDKEGRLTFSCLPPTVTTLHHVCFHPLDLSFRGGIQKTPQLLVRRLKHPLSRDITDHVCQ